MNSLHPGNVGVARLRYRYGRPRISLIAASFSEVLPRRKIDDNVNCPFRSPDIFAEK
jgi:hypothetical protein